MKNIKNHFIYGHSLTTTPENRRKAHSLSRTIAEEKLAFKDGAELGSLSIGIEDGATKRMIRRIVEKRVCKEYWKRKKNGIISDNKHRAATKRYVSRVTQRIFGAPIDGFHYVAA